MATIPLPALDIRPQQAQPNLLQDYGQLMEMRNQLQMQPLRVQEAQQQVQSGQLENQRTQQDLAARQALNQAYQNSMTADENGQTKFDPDKLQQSLASGPAAYQTPAVMKGITDYQTSRADLQQKTQALQVQAQDMLGSAASAVKAAGYDRPLAHSLLDGLPQSPQLNQIRQTIDADPQGFRQMIDSAVQNSPKQQELANAQKVAQIRANTPEAQEMNSWIVAHPHPDGTPATPAEYQQFRVNQGVAADVAKETNPAVIAAKEHEAASEAAARQAVQDGDPRSAAQMLIDGEIAPAQIISSRKPEFAQKAFQAAHDLSGGTWNAQQADADFSVARSPANVAFFGSAKSLVDPGGTLDQLKAAGQDLPQGQFPALNTIADWEKLASGSGPIAKAAAVALGVADDYSKVMGGGVGTDTSRLQVLKSIALAQSPQQRQQALDGIRGAVASQMNSRIGANPVLRRMYGEGNGAQQPGGQNGAPQGGKSGVGSFIVQGGHKFKVTAVDASGRPTAAEAVQ